MVDDEHLQKAGEAAVLVLCRSLGRGFDLGVEPDRERGGLDLWTARGDHRLVML